MTPHPVDAAFTASRDRIIDVFDKLLAYSDRLDRMERTFTDAETVAVACLAFIAVKRGVDDGADAGG